MNLLLGYIFIMLGRKHNRFQTQRFPMFVAIDEQSSDIAMGVDKALEAKQESAENKMTDEQIEANAHRVFLHERVQHRVRNRIADFIRMPLCYRF